MIHLDTNYLIGVLVKDSIESQKIQLWLQEKEEIGISSIVWFEVLVGPATSSISNDEILALSALCRGKIIEFDESMAELGAKLYNHLKRKRGTQVDCMIAATVLMSGAKLATKNKKDFSEFGSFGLELVG